MTATWTDDLDVIRRAPFVVVGGAPFDQPSVGAIDETVVVGYGHRQHQPRLETLTVVHRLHASARHPEDRDLRRVNDGREVGAADTTEVRNGEGASIHFVGSDLLAACTLGGRVQLDGQLGDVLLVHGADHGHEKPALGIDRDADVIVALVDDFLRLHIDARVELGKHFERGSHDFQKDRRQRELGPRLFHLFAVLLANHLDLGDVDLVVLSDVGNGRPRLGHGARGNLSHLRHRLATHRPPLAVFCDRGGCGFVCRGASAGHQRSRVRFDVVLENAASGARSVHLADIHAKLACETPQRWRSGCGVRRCGHRLHRWGHCNRSRRFVFARRGFLGRRR
jgi:hypothetical protein